MKQQGTSIINRVLLGAIVVMTIIVARQYLFTDENGMTAEDYFDIGVLYDEDFRFEEAEAMFSQAIALRPRYALAYGWRCSTRYTTGNSELALDDCNRALELDPSLNWVYVDRCQVYGELGEYDLALADCERAELSQVNDDNLQNALGLLNARMGNHEASVEHYSNAIEFDPLDGILYFNRGRAYLRLEDYDAAIEDFQIAVQYDSNYYNAHDWLASTLYDEYRYKEGIEATSYWINLFSDEPEPFVWRASFYTQVEDYDAALADLETAKEIDVNYPFTYSNLGYLYSRIDDVEASVDAYCTYIAIHDNDDIRDYVFEWVEENGGC